MDTATKCIMCGKYSGSGISILNSYICEECEKVLVNTDINDEKYDEYKKIIKDKIYNKAV